MTNHTPGPWIAWDDGVTIGIDATDIDGPVPLAIAEVVDHGDMTDPEQLRADQSLIASAPELLEIVRGMFEVMTLDCDVAPCIGSMAPAEQLCGQAQAILARLSK